MRKKYREKNNTNISFFFLCLLHSNGNPSHYLLLSLSLCLSSSYFLHYLTCTGVRRRRQRRHHTNNTWQTSMCLNRFVSFLPLTASFIAFCQYALTSIFHFSFLYYAYLSVRLLWLYLYVLLNVYLICLTLTNTAKKIGTKKEREREGEVRRERWRWWRLKIINTSWLICRWTLVFNHALYLHLHILSNRKAFYPLNNFRVQSSWE